MDTHDSAAGTAPAYPATDPSRRVVLPGPEPTDTSGELHEALDAIAKARHDLNNHLTSALAEIQLLLMDVACDGLEESYQVIHEQLHEMRRVVASIAHFSPSK